MLTIDYAGTNPGHGRGKIVPMTNPADDGPEEDWRLREWMAHLGKRQADLVKDLGWTKNRAHFIWHSTQPYMRKDVNEVAAWLGIKIHELFMAPRDALALRRLRETAAAIVAENESEPHEQAPGVSRNQTGS